MREHARGRTPKERPPLTPAQRDLAERAFARATWQAWRCFEYQRDQGLYVPLDELCEAGMLAVVYAAADWRPDMAPFLTYSNVRIRFALRDALRAWYRRRRYSEIPERHPDRLPRPDAAATARDDLGHLAATLPPELWRALQLRYASEASIADAAQEMGVDPRTYRRYINRATLAAREALS